MSASESAWGELRRAAPRTVEVRGVRVGRGSRVRLHPDPGGDVLDRALEGRVAVVEGVDADMEGGLHLAVTVEDDPGRDLGEARMPGHRFFFSACEVEPLPGGEPQTGPRVLVAGIGNVFLGDDGVGVEVARRLLDRPLPAGVDVRDFGIKGMDLVYALNDGYDAVVFVDAARRGAPPGTVSLVEHEPEADEPVVLDTHGMDPVRVHRLARELGPVPEKLLVVCIEPARVVDADAGEDMAMELSAPLRAAVGAAVKMVEQVVVELSKEESWTGSTFPERS